MEIVSIKNNKSIIFQSNKGTEISFMTVLQFERGSELNNMKIVCNC